MPALDVIDESSESSTDAQTLDVVSSAEPAVDSSAESSPADDVSEVNALSIVRDVVDARKADTPEGSSPEGEKVEEQPKPDAETKEQDNENYSDVPFAKHPRFQQLLRKAKVNEQDATNYRNVQTFMDTNGISAEEAAEGFQIMALMRSNPAAAWEMLKPYAQNLAIAAGEVLPQELVQRVNAGEMSQAAAIEFSRAQAKLKSVENHQSFVEQQQQKAREQQHAQSLRNAADAWAQERQARDPSFEAKQELLTKEVLFLQRIEGIPDSPAGVQDQLKRAYAKVVLPSAVPSPVAQRPKAPARPTMSGQGNAQTQARPKTTMDIIDAVVARRN